MKPTWATIERLYQGALQRAAADRAAYLDAACAGDSELRNEVESLLVSVPDSFLKSGALEMPGVDLVGQEIGVYKVVALLGAGGMGEVYRARDTRLGRDVALKILPPMFTGDRERLARFEREARLLATLNHSHIGAIYGFEEADGIRALVLELLEGQTLAERIASGPLSLKEAQVIARQIADALDAAHEKGIVHRDLKPANIAITPDGTAKVLDFGLAKAASSTGSDPDPSRSPTMTVGRTRDGAILGTAAYMSPEQARGKPVDKRSDIWAFGCVFFEMITGKRAFPGETTSDAIAMILEREPDWNALPAATPANVRRLLERCLDKDPKRRVRDIGDVIAELDRPSVPIRVRSVSVAKWISAAALVAAAIAVSGGLLLWNRRAVPVVSRAVARFTLQIPTGEHLFPGTSIAVSPDGAYVAFQTGSPATRKLFLRALAESQAVLVTSSSGGYPFFSPDSKWLAFSEQGKLKKISVHGGPSTKLADRSAIRGGSWGDDGSIVFSPEARAGLVRLPPGGGALENVTTPDASRAETSHRFPVLLPGSKAVVYRAEGTTYADGTIAVTPLDTKQQRILIEDGGIGPAYLGAGYLTYIKDGALMAAVLDRDRLAIVGTPVQVAENVGAYGISDDGTLIYMAAPSRETELEWRAVDGATEPLKLPPAEYTHPRISPDGKRLALHVQKGTDRDISLYDLSSATLSRLAFSGADDWPAWSFDGATVFYASNHAGTAWDLMSKPADGSRDELPILTRSGEQVPRAASPDGRWLVYTETNGSAPLQLRMLSLRGDGETRAFTDTKSIAWYPVFSPDSRWLAYVSNESGSGEIYVRPADGSAGRWLISAGGREPVWSADRKRLYYRLGQKMMAAAVQLAPSFSMGKTTELFEGDFSLGSVGSANYDVSSDGKRFLMVKPSASDKDLQLNVVTNFVEELTRKMGGGK